VSRRRQGQSRNRKPDRAANPGPRGKAAHNEHADRTDPASPSVSATSSSSSSPDASGQDISKELEEKIDLFGEGSENRQFVIKRDVRKRLDRYLQERLKGISRSRVQQLIELGGVKLNGKVPKSSATVIAGDVIDIVLPAPAVRTIVPEEIPLHILYEDANYIVINKQAGLIVHPARSHLYGTLIHGLAYHFKKQQEEAGGKWQTWKTRGFSQGDDDRKVDTKNKTANPKSKNAAVAPESAKAPNDEDAEPEIDLGPDGEDDFSVEGLSTVGVEACRPGIVHRLDRFTTGVMVVAKSDEAHWGIAKQFEQRKTKKAYMAIVHGNFDTEGGVIDEPIGKHPTIREAYAIRRDRYGKESVTLYRVREQYEGYSLVELELKTGRTHQIRVHMTYIGHPLVGDLVYGGEAIGQKEIEDPPTPAGARRLMTFARTKEEGLREMSIATERDDVLLKTPGLHATLLGFHDPVRDKPVEFTAPLHEPMLTVIKALRQRPVDKPCAKSGYFVDLTAAAPK
jgi:23S rRNA pseudouridine1911/1915/1917 synthase